MNYQFVKQEDWNDCGLACLAMIIENFHHHRISLFALKEHLNFNPNPERGLSFFDLLKIGEDYHLKGDGFHCEMEMLGENAHQCPFILQVKNEQGIDHYVVLNKIEGEIFYLNDPSTTQAIQKYTYQQLSAIFLGKILIFKKHGKLRIKIDWTTLKKLIFKHWISLLWLILMNIFANFFWLLTASFIKVFSHWLTQEQINWKELILFSVFAFLGAFFEWTQSLCLFQLQQKNSHDLLFRFLSFKSRTGIEEQVLARNLTIFQETSELFQLIWTIIVKTIISLIFIPILSIWIADINFFFCFLPWIFLVLILLGKAFFLHRIVFLKPEQKNCNQSSSQLINHYLSNQTLIKKRNLQKVFEKRIQVQAEKREHLSQKNNWQQSTISFWEKFLGKLFYFVLLVGVYFAFFTQQIDYANLIYLSVLANYYLTLINQTATTWLQLVFSKTLFLHLNWIKEEIKKQKSLTKIQSVSFTALTLPSLLFPLSETFNHSFLVTGSSILRQELLKLFLTGSFKPGTFKINGQDFQEWEPNFFILTANQELIPGTILENLFNWEKDIDSQQFALLQPLVWLKKYQIDSLTLDLNRNLNLQQKQLVNFLAAFHSSTALFYFDSCLEALPMVDQKELLQLFFMLKPEKFVIFSSQNSAWENNFLQKMVLVPMI